MGGNTNIGYLVTAGILKPEKDGYAGRMKTNKTCVAHPNTSTSRIWERKLSSALNTILCVSKRTGIFERKLLDDLSSIGCEKQGDKKMGKEEMLEASKAIVDAAGKKAQGMLVQIDRAKAGMHRAEKSAIQKDDIVKVAIAKERLLALENDVKGLSLQVGKMRENLNLDSTL